MINYIKIYYLVILVICVTSIHTDDEEENASDEDESKSLEVESSEDFKRNLKEKLLQLTLRELKNETTGKYNSL